MSVTIGQQTEAAAVVEHMGGDVLESLAALAGAPDGVTELAFNALPEGTQDWLIAYGLASEIDGRLQVTDLGSEVIDVAALRCPQPYADVALGDLAEATQAGIERLVASSGIRVKEPSGDTSPVVREATAARRAGQRFAVLISERIHPRTTRGSGAQHPENTPRAAR